MPFKKTIISFALFFSGCLSLFCLIYINLPIILEAQIQKNLPEFLKSRKLDFSIQNIGISNLFISKIRLSEGIGIDSLSMDYRIKSLKQIEVKKVTISGLTFEASLDEKMRFQIQGFPLPESSSSEDGKDGVRFIEFLPEKFVFKNSRVSLIIMNEKVLIPFEILSNLKLQEKKIMIQTQIHPFGETIVSNLIYDFEKGIESIRVEGKSFDLDHLGPYLPKNMKEIKLFGAVDFILESFSPKKNWNLKIPTLGPIHPLDIAFEEINGGILIDQDIISAGGTFRVVHPLLSENEIKYNVNIDTGKGLITEFFLNSGPIKAKSGVFDVSFPETAISGKIFIGENNKPDGQILIKSSKGKIESFPYNTLASDISFEIPIRFQDSKENPVGKFSIPSVAYSNQYVFSSTGNIFQTGTRQFKIAGNITSKMLPAVKIRFNSILDLENHLKAFFGFETNRFKLKYSDIKKFIPKTQTPFELDLLTSVKGSVDFSEHPLKTHLQTNITDGSMSFPDLKLTAKGINARIDFNDLLIPKSVPGQILTIQSIDVNKIRISEAKIQFSLESSKSLLIENIRFKWCNGIISTEALRFPQENGDYHLTLFCDRLELTELLKQMGVFHAEGDGTLNGRIPIVYSDGKIAFNNGFLFSTPGSKGKVVIENTDSIIAGIPTDSPEFSQLDVAREALKDFNYEWVKLTLNTQGDTLAVNMELDGKPEKLLPFEYKKEFGGFARVDASSPGSHFQGIKLDVNLKLPFNDVMKFGNQLNTLLNE